MHDEPQLLDVVALLEDLPERGLRRGQVGTVVVQLAQLQAAGDEPIDLVIAPAIGHA